MDLAELEQRILRIIEQLKPRYAERLTLKTRGRVFLLNVNQIIWLEAQGNYVRVHHEQGSHLLRETIGALQLQLDPRRFLRIHRSAIVQINRIKELRRWFHGEYHLILQNGTQLKLSRNYRAQLQEVIGQRL